MLLEKMSWFDVEKYLESSDKVVVPLGSVEQHAYLSVMTDSLIPTHIAQAATDDLGIVLCPTVHYGVSGWASAYPGTISLSSHTYLSVIKDILQSLISSGFKKIIFFNGHGSNNFSGEAIIDVLNNVQDDVSVYLYEWYKMKETRSLLESTGFAVGHANWAENFDFTRISSIQPQLKDKVEMNTFFIPPKKRRKILKDGSIGGPYFTDTIFMNKVFSTAVREFKSILEAI